MSSMKEQNASMLGQVLDVPFDYPILMMGANSAESDCLSTLLHSFSEEVVGKSSIVGVIAFDGDSMGF